MTQTIRKPATRKSQKVNLEANQVYIKLPGCPESIQTVVEGYDNLTYYSYSWQPYRNTLSYKGEFQAFLDRQPDGTFKHVYDSAFYASLPDFIERCYKRYPSYLRSIDSERKRLGLEDWCVRQTFATTTLAIRLTVPEQERKRIEQVAKASYNTLEELALKAIYAYLPELESLYKDNLSKVEDEVNMAMSKQ